MHHFSNSEQPDYHPGFSRVPRCQDKMDLTGSQNSSSVTDCFGGFEQLLEEKGHLSKHKQHSGILSNSRISSPKPNKFGQWGIFQPLLCTASAAKRTSGHWEDVWGNFRVCCDAHVLMICFPLYTLWSRESSQILWSSSPYCVIRRK